MNTKRCSSRIINSLFRRGGALAVLASVLVLIPMIAFGAASVDLAWDANTEDDLAGYKIHYGTVSGHYSHTIDVYNTTQYTLKDLEDGVTYYLAATAYDAATNQSAYSEELVHTTASPNHNPANPSVPSGSSSGYTQTNYSFSTTASDPDGDALEFRYDWDDASISDWGAASQSHAWSSSDNFCVKAQAKDDNGALSGWSNCKSITISVIVTREPVADSDKDGVPDDQDAFPNDPYEYLDTDGDLQGNNADTDDDNDGMPDIWELTYGLDPLKDDAANDPDGDGDSNINEYNLRSDPSYNESNLAPDPPQLLNPGNDEIVGLTPLLETETETEAGGFYDPDDNDVHSQTRWKIIRVEDESIVFDVTTSSSLTALKVPKLILEEDTDYSWQVKFIDNQGTASEWSESGYFTTEFLEQDSDGNGVPDHQEVDATIDLDQDGIMDRDQEDIKCVATETGDFKIGISIREDENAESILSIQSETPDDTDLLLSALDGPKFLAFGLIHFKLLVKEPGDEVLVTIYLSKAAYDDGIWYKYDPVNAEWVDYSEFIDFSADRKMVYLTLTDGGFGDADGIENGVIVDPLALRTATDHSSSGSDFFANDIVDNLNPSGMCFISAADPRSADRQPLSLWREIRSLELSIVFILLMLAYIGKEISTRVKQSRRIGRKTSLMEGWRNS